MSYSLIGKDFTPPDVWAKVTGSAKYSEDFRVDGMLFSKVLSSPMPHARVVRIDASEALKMPGVAGILTADDLPAASGANNTILTKEPSYIGQPILALAAETETLAADALEKIKIEYEELEFTVDPLQSLFPGGPNAQSAGNVAGEKGFTSIKWSAKDFAIAGDSRLPMGQAVNEWGYGDAAKAIAGADLVLDESFVTGSNAHHCLETRSAMAYWENGKCHLHASSQSGTYPVPHIAGLLGIKNEDLVFIAEYCGGGFGSKGTAYPMMAIPAYLSKKLNRPVMNRVSREEEYYVGSARPGFQGQIKMGFNKSGRLVGVDLFIVQESGAYAGGFDFYSAAEAVSLIYTPENMSYRGIPVATNTPPRGAQRGPGQNQIALIIEPLMDKAAAKLGIDRVAIRNLNDPAADTKFGQGRGGLTSCFLREALAQGAREFDWEEKRSRSGQRNGSKVTGVGIGQAWHSAGNSGFDGLICLTPEGKLHIHTGVGNLGTYSHSATARVAAEVLNCSWENCVVVRGDTRKNLPWNYAQWGSNTSFTETRTNYAAAMDAKSKLLEIAAMDLGGNPDDYELANETVVSKTDPTKVMTFADAAKRAIALGGKFSGQEASEDINELTKRSVAAIAGTGLVGVARDPKDVEGTPPAFSVAFMEIEVDLETGKHEIKDFVTVADCGTVLHPRGLSTQLKGGSVQGFGFAAFERHVYDPQNGLAANVALYQAKPPGILDVPDQMKVSAVDLADPQNPVGARGIGEPPMGSAGAALISAISDALGGHYFNRSPVTTDQVLNAASGRPQSHKPLAVNTF